MNIDEQIAVMLAYKAGKKIQCRGRLEYQGKWTDVLDPTWNFSASNYRVKPEKPEVVFVNRYKNHKQSSYCYPSFQRAKEYVEMNPSKIGAKFIEVTPEVEVILTTNGIDCNESGS